MKRSPLQTLLILGCVLSLWISALGASDWDELKVKRQEIFEFEKKPVVTRKGDQVEIAFTAKGYCDVTVAIENEQGKILRHLASGVLGARAPEPFQKNTLSQNVVWDGKDDRKIYLDNKESLQIRVSLGLKPTFEKSLFWSPKKRTSDTYPLISAAPEGVYVYDGWGSEHLRLFDRKGDYVRTVYPFPADKVEGVKGVKWLTLQPDGQRVMQKQGKYQNTFLTSGPNAHQPGFPVGTHGIYMHDFQGRAANAMAVRDGRIYLANLEVNRLATDGTTGGQELMGAPCNFIIKHEGMMPLHGTNFAIGPSSAAVSPDKKWLYLTGYIYRLQGFWNCLNGVMRINLESDGAKMEPFAGDMKVAGGDNAHFNCPSSVSCDRQGNVYVSDFVNARIQVFSQEGKHLKTIPAVRPAQVVIHQRTDEILVFSWPLFPRSYWGEWGKLSLEQKKQAFAEQQVTRMGTLNDPRKTASYPLPLNRFDSALGGLYEMTAPGPVPYYAEVDSWAENLTIWLGSEQAWAVGWTNTNADAPHAVGSWDNDSLKILTEKNGKLELVRDFGKETKAAIERIQPAVYFRQRLYVNPKSGKVYLAEGQCGASGNGFNDLLEMDPDSGKVNVVQPPHSGEDLCFDQDGLLYLRTTNTVGRFDMETGREVPWDYGEERAQVQEGSGRAGKLISALMLPADVPWHQGGFWVSPLGNLAVSCYTEPMGETRKDEKKLKTGKGYEPRFYPGRCFHHKAAVIHVWDRHGKLLYPDAIPGLAIVDGLYIDKDDALYVMAGANRILDGQRYFNGRTETVMKFRPAQGRLISTKSPPVPLPEDQKPKRNADVQGYMQGSSWLEGCEWMYGTVGYVGSGPGESTEYPASCHCANARFSVDYFGRSFAPELDRCAVGVVDTNGNLIMRIGRYGNADSAGPNSLVPLGGDEVGLYYPAYVATHSDKRLYIADAGNARVSCVRIGYHLDERIPLKGVPDSGTPASDKPGR